GYILGGLFGSSFVTQLIFIGIIGGAGIGLAYVVPIAVGVKWFPDKKGMVTGLAVAGFGFGATIWVKSAGSWFGLINNLNFFGLGGVQSVFLLYGIIFLIAVLIGSIVMIDPPAGYVPEGWTPPEPVSSEAGANPGSAALGMTNFSSAEIIKTPQFYMIWVTFLFSSIAGLMVIYCIKLFGIDSLKAAGMTAAAASAAAGTAMALYAIFNGLGRIIWGTVSDKIGRKMSIFLMCLFQGIIMLLFYNMGGAASTLIIGACIIGFNFGGNFALFPAITADYYGNENVGLNYGLIFASYGIAGVIGPQIAGYFKDAAQGGSDPSLWVTPFIIAGVVCLLGAAVMLLSKPPKKA
ncbi:MAG: MFS transporter, partial [Proteobacteria bacterium]|nr:MFS transporter [Pseudomonadota bacterium]